MRLLLTLMLAGCSGKMMPSLEADPTADLSSNDLSTSQSQSDLSPAQSDLSPAQSDLSLVPFGLDADQKLRAMQLISVFENDTIVLAYDYVEALGDGRGYTCGLGFTTGTGDAYQVVKDYTAQVASNALATFLPRLQQLANSGSGSTSGLTGFPAAWMQSAADPIFRKVQENVQDQNSYLPALAHAQTVGLKTALGLTILYDTVWMHGDGSDADGTQALIDKTGKLGADEGAWLSSFLAVRRADLLNPADSSTQAEWSMAVGRVDTLADLVKAKNFNLQGPIDVQHGYNVVVP